MFPDGGPGVIDIVYGDSLFNLMFWVLFGLGGQLVIGILVFGRRAYWVETCWGILRVQLIIMVLINIQTYCFCCPCFGDERAIVNLATRLFLMKCIYFLGYFSVMSVAIWWRYKPPARKGPLQVAGVIAPIVDLGLMLISVLVLLFV